MATVEEEIFRMGAEIDALTSSGKAQAIACAVVTEDGNIRTWLRYLDGTKFTLLAAADMLHDSALRHARSTDFEIRDPERK